MKQKRKYTPRKRNQKERQVVTLQLDQSGDYKVFFIEVEFSFNFLGQQEVKGWMMRTFKNSHELEKNNEDGDAIRYSIHPA